MRLNAALKEWAVVVAALERGETTILLRKGGIVEQTGEFEVEHRQFLLFPSTYHPSREQIRPEFWPLMDEVEAERPPAGCVRISAWAEAYASFPVADAAVARALAPYTIYTPEYAEERFTMQKHRTLQLVELRVYRLPEPRTIPLRREYGGCTSWVDLAESFEVDPLEATPAIEYTSFARLANRIRATRERVSLHASWGGGDRDQPDASSYSEW